MKNREEDSMSEELKMPTKYQPQEVEVDATKSG